MRHCIVTEEYAGANFCTGLGVSAKGFAQTLARHGHQVDVVVTDLNASERGNLGLSDTGNIRLYFLSDIARADAAIFYPVDDITKSYVASVSYTHLTLPTIYSV